MVVAEVVVVCERFGGVPNENGGGNARWGGLGGEGLWLREAGCPGRAGCPGHGPDVRGCPSQEELLATGGVWGKIRRILPMKIGEKWGKS